MFKHVACTIAIAAALATPVAARAANLLFVLEGSRNASFQLGAMPTPSSFTSLQTNFNNVAGTYNGVVGVASLINFGRSDGVFSPASLNILAPGLGFTQLSGDVLFSGSTAHPVFTPGVYQISNPFFGGAATLTISQLAASAVPEPQSWGLMIAGFGMVGLAARRRRRTGAALA